jgi:hypothetical protein
VAKKVCVCGLVASGSSVGIGSGGGGGGVFHPSSVLTAGSVCFVAFSADRKYFIVQEIEPSGRKSIFRQFYREESTGCIIEVFRVRAGQSCCSLLPALVVCKRCYLLAQEVDATQSSVVLKPRAIFDNDRAMQQRQGHSGSSSNSPVAAAAAARAAVEEQEDEEQEQQEQRGAASGRKSSGGGRFFPTRGEDDQDQEQGQEQDESESQPLLARRRRD